jgi:hypothetical protein
MIDELEVCLVNQPSGVERPGLPVAPELATRNAAELPVDERDQLLKRLVVAVCTCMEQPSDLADPDRRRGLVGRASVRPPGSPIPGVGASAVVLHS